jgi:hypothetical protein
MKKYILCFVLVLSITLFITSCASLQTAGRVPIAGVASGTPEELKQFPVVFNGEHIMNIYLKFIGKTPEDKYSYGARILPPERRDEVDFYHRELENISEYTMEIFEYRWTFIDKQGKRYEEPPTKRNELIEMCGISWMTLYPHERQIGKDNWVTGQVGTKGVLTYKIRNLDTNEIFAIEIIYTRIP